MQSYIFQLIFPLFLQRPLGSRFRPSSQPVRSHDVDARFEAAREDPIGWIQSQRVMYERQVYFWVGTYF